MASVRLASSNHRALENRCDAVMDEDSSYFIDTNSFSAHDFDRFVHSLEETYNAHFRTQQLDHSLGKPNHRGGEEIDGEDEYSIYQSLSRYAQDVELISSYGGTSMSSTYPSTSEESLQPSDAPHNTRIREEPSPRIVKRKSFLNIFQYFDEDVTFAEERSDEEPERATAGQRPAPDGRFQQVEKKKLVLREWDTNVERSKPHLHQRKQVGRLNSQLLKMFEGETAPQPCNYNNNNVSKARSAPGTTNTSAGEKKVPIMQHNRIEQPKKAVNTVKRAAPKPPHSQSVREVECRRVNLQQRPVPSVKIVNAAPKVPQNNAAQVCAPTKQQADQRNLNGSTVSGRDKCYVRNINDLFLQYRSRERSEHGALPDFTQHVREAIEQIEKLEESHVRSVLGQHAFDEAVPPPTSAKCAKEPENVAPPEQEPPEPEPAEKEESALDMHYRLRHDTYRLQMHNLIETDQFVRMATPDRDRLDLLDTIFNRSHLSLIHTVLALIQENISKGDQVLVQVGSEDAPNDATFVDAIAGGSYRIDGMTTSAAGENCVVLDVIAVDEVTGRMIKITVEFVIDVANRTTNVRQRTVNNSDEFHFVVRLVFEVMCKASKRLASSFYTVDCGMYWDRDRVVPFLRKCARTVRTAVRAVPGLKRHQKWWSAPPENELQKSHETGTNLSEHQLRVQASLQRLNIPDWYKQYSGKDGPANQTAPTVAATAASGTAAGGGILRKRNSDVGRWTGLSSKTTSLSSLGSHRSDRSPVMLSPSAHSHHGQTGFSRWSTSHLNSNQTSPSVSTRGSFTRGGLNASVISGYSTASTTAGQTGASANAGSTIRNSFRQPYLGWRSQEKLSQPRTPAERLASSLLQQQQQGATGKQKEQQLKEQQKGQHQKDESVVTPEIQSSIIEVTSAIVHYVNDQTNRHSRSRSTSPSQRCWLESSFVGTRPLDSPQTPLIENSSVLGSSGHSQQQQQLQQQQNPHPQTAGDHYRFNAGRMNGVGASGAVPTFSLPPEHQSPGSATLEDVLASLLGLPADSHRSSAPNSNNSSISNHTLQIEPMQTRRRSEGDAAGTRKRNDSGGSMAISSATTTTTTSGSTNPRSPHAPTAPSAAVGRGPTVPIASEALLGAGGSLEARIARRVSLDSAEAAGHHHHRGHDYLKCRYPRCDATATLAEARKTYKSCHNCSHLYCSRECRRAHWERHRKACLHSRVSALCRLVLSTCKDDADTLRHLSALARRGYLSQGRGVVRILFRSPESADGFIKQGFQCLGEVSYVRWPDLLPAEMGPELYSELLKLSTEYKPDSKMLIYVAICVVSEAPGSATAPVKWERQLVSRCAKLKLCRTVVSEIAASGPGGERTGPRADTVGDVLVLSFNILAKTTARAREQVSQNVQTILRQRGVHLRKHYPEVSQRLATFVEGSTDRFLPVTLHPRDNVTGRSFVCIIMPNYGDSDRVQFPVSENSDDRVVTVDVGADLGDDLTSKL
uniref:Apical junction molecule ajm1 alpha/beta domain-containing protein n=1 Tax=Anopheles dirus TaxID=7168 RepID=A0A182NUM2_9DIPT